MTLAVTIGGHSQTAYLKYDSMTMRFNTFDLTLVDPANIPAEGDTVTCTGPSWSGTVTAVKSSDPVDRIGHVFYAISCTNTATQSSSSAPFALSDTPDNSTSFGYRGLSVQGQSNTDKTTTTTGSCTIEEPGLWPGMTFALTSTNQGYSGALFTLTDVSVSWPTESSPAFELTFGDPVMTFDQWVHPPGFPGTSGGPTVSMLFDVAMEPPNLSASNVGDPTKRAYLYITAGLSTDPIISDGLTQDGLTPPANVSFSADSTAGDGTGIFAGSTVFNRQYPYGTGSSGLLYAFRPGVPVTFNIYATYYAAGGHAYTIGSTFLRAFVHGTTTPVPGLVQKIVATASGNIAPNGTLLIGSITLTFYPGGYTNPIIAKGDLVAGDVNAAPTRLAVGTDGKVLTADHTTTTGLAWTTAAGGGPNLDGGLASSTYGGTTAINCGGAT